MVNKARYQEKWEMFMAEMSSYIGPQPTSFTGPHDDEVGERNLTLAQWYQSMLSRGITPEAAAEAVLSTYPDLGPDDIEMMQKQALNESEPYQQAVSSVHSEKKRGLIGNGEQPNNVAGGPYSDKPTYKRNRSAPPGFGGSLEEDTDGSI